MAWVYLLLAIVIEVIGTTAMKLSNGLQQLGPSIVVITCYVISVGFLTLAVRTIDVSIAYALWSAIGMTLITVIGILYFGESSSAMKIGSIAVIALGVVGLHLSERLGS